MNTVKNNKGFLTTVAALFIGVVGTTWYLKFRDCEECKRYEDDDQSAERCDQSTFDENEKKSIKTIDDTLKTESKDNIYLGKEKVEEDTLGEQVISEGMRTSQEWYRNDNNVCIRDPDGWRDNEDPKKFWKDIPISQEDYIIRRNLSTLSFRSDKGDPFPEDNIDDLI